MARSILIYNMPEDIKEFLKIESEKHDFEIIECDDNDLSTKISVLLKEEDGEQIQSDEEGVDINFLMINKFNNQILHRFIKDMQREDIYIPNRRFNHLQSVMERINQQAGSFLFDNKFLVCYIYNTV